MAALEEAPLRDGCSGERAAKCARLGEPRIVLQDLTNGLPLPLGKLAKAPGSCSSKGEDEEAVSTGLERTRRGLGGLADLSEEEEEDEEDPFSDFEGFPPMAEDGCGSSERPAVNSSPLDEDLLRPTPTTREESPAEGEAAERLAERCEEGSGEGGAAWRSPTEEVLAQGGPRPFRLSRGWMPRSSPKQGRGSPGEGRVRRVLTSLRFGGAEGGLETAPVVCADLDETPQDCEEYSRELSSRLVQQEAGVEPSLLAARNPEVTGENRATAVDWIVEVQVKFGLRTESLFLAVSLLDRYLAIRRVRKKDLQLVCVSAVFIAAKFEEIDPPDVKDFVVITKQACRREQILTMEVQMLTSLEFCLCRSTAAHFFEWYQRANGCSDQHRHLFQYLLELAILEHDMTLYSPLQQAASALLVSCGILKLRPVVPEALAAETEANEPAVRKCAKRMCGILEGAKESSHQAVRKKFLKPEYSCVASLDYTA